MEGKNPEAKVVPLDDERGPVPIKLSAAVWDKFLEILDNPAPGTATVTVTGTQARSRRPRRWSSRRRSRSRRPRRLFRLP